MGEPTFGCVLLRLDATFDLIGGSVVLMVQSWSRCSLWPGQGVEPW
jgi:hypothetical protein